MIQHIFRIKGQELFFYMNDNGDVVFRKKDDETEISANDAKTVFNKLLTQIEVFEAEQRDKNSFRNRIARKLFKK
jgi:hypothetical protein